MLPQQNDRSQQIKWEMQENCEGNQPHEEKRLAGNYQGNDPGCDQERQPGKHQLSRLATTMNGKNGNQVGAQHDQIECPSD